MKNIRVILVLVSFLCCSVCLSSQGYAADQLKVGFVSSKTGKYSGEGSRLFEGVDLWVNQLNSKGGVFVKAWGKKVPIKFVWYDDRSDISTTARLYEKLINGDKVDILIGPWGSGQSFASTAITEKYKIPIVLTTAGGENIYNRGFKYVFQGGNMISSKVMEPWGPFLAKYRDQVKTIAIVYEDFNFTLELYKYLVPSLQKAGVNIIFSEKYPVGSTDFSSLLMKIKSANPEGIILLNIMPASVYFTRQMVELGIRPKFYVTNIGPGQKDDFVNVLGKLSLGIFEPGFFDFRLLEKSAKGVAESYKAKYNRTITPDEIFGYRAGQIWEQVLAKADTFDKEEFTKVLRTSTFDTIQGRVKYNEQGLNTVNVPIVTQHLTLESMDVVWPESEADRKPVIPYPYFR
jgi:branched-chain amino acid transport system substrate-binding protein